MTRSKYLFVIAILLAGVVLVGGCSAKYAGDGDTVSVHYTGTLADGTEFDSSRDRDPLRFTLGAGQMIPGFEDAVYAMKVGETKTVTIPAAQAYGEREEDLIIEMDRDQLAGDTDPQVGQTVGITYTNGQQGTATVTEVTETTITLDANLPLAGEDLTFEIKLVKVE